MTNRVNDRRNIGRDGASSIERVWRSLLYEKLRDSLPDIDGFKKA